MASLKSLTFNSVCWVIFHAFFFFWWGGGGGHLLTFFNIVKLFQKILSGILSDSVQNSLDHDQERQKLPLAGKELT